MNSVLDILVLVAYFSVMIGIGVYASRRIKRQEDYFLGGRSFGKLLQTFAAFGAGTGSSDPVATGKTTFTSGMSGMWSVMYWLFVTPFYWITGVWYRRMRHYTLGDWFVERYQSKALGAAYTAFGLLFMIVYGSMLFSAIGKVATPLIGTDVFVLFGQEVKIELVLVPAIGLVVLVYGIAGGLEAAYFTDLVQGICIILLSLILIPFGLMALVNEYGADGDGMLAGFRIMHERIPKEHFSIVGSVNTSEFPLHRIIAVVIINLIGVVIQPHFIVTGGGTAKTETNARIGLVVGNFLKRFCTVGWVLTGLIALALFADSPELNADPDLTWGIASRELLGPGLNGLMLACLLAALMSSVDAYMVVGSALVVRNVYRVYVDSEASDATCLRLGRVTGAVVVIGAVFVSLVMWNVLKQLELTWRIPILFAAVFWVGMFWRRATATAAWGTIVFCAIFFFILPVLLPKLMPSLRDQQYLTDHNMVLDVTTVRKAASSDVERREANRERNPDLPALTLGEAFADTKRTSNRAVFWTGGLVPVDADGKDVSGSELESYLEPVGDVEQQSDNVSTVKLRFREGTRLRGKGNLGIEFLLYKWLGFDLQNMSNATLSTLELPAKIVVPFLVMIGLSLVTRPNEKAGLDRYYAKMRTPVLPDPKEDAQALEAAYDNPDLTVRKKLFPGTNFEFLRPTTTDIVGFIVCFLMCFVVIGMAMLVAGIGG